MQPAPHPRRWAALAVIALAQFMVIADTSIIGVALPDIRSDLGFSPGDLSWVFNAYVVAFGGLLLLGGRLSDLLGAKRVFLIGWAVLAAGSLAAGLADSTGVEIAARAAQGVGAALIAPSALTLLMILFGSNPKELMKAFAICLALLGLFVAIQAGRREPLMRLSILRTPNLAAANLAQLLLGAAWIPMWFFLNLYLQQVLGYGAFEGGAALLPMTVAIMVLMVVVAPRVIARFGAKTPIVAGMLMLAAGMAVLSPVRPDGSFVVDVLPASLIAATGMALAFIPSLGTAISSAKPEEGGLASG